MLKRGLPPIHPGEILREEYIAERRLTITQVAKGLGITRKNLSSVVNGHSNISPELAVKLSEAFGNSSEFWLNIQRNYDLWYAEKRVNRTQIQHFAPLKSI